MRDTRIHPVLRGMLVFAVALLFVGNLPVHAQGMEKTRNVIEASYTIINPCTGEPMTVTDRWQIVFLERQDANGCTSIVMHANDMGSKAVTASGRKYQYPYSSNVREFNASSCEGCTIEVSQTLNYQFVGQGKDPNFRVHGVVKFVYNFCTNEFTVIRENFTATCDGEPF